MANDTVLPICCIAAAGPEELAADLIRRPFINRMMSRDSASASESATRFFCPFDGRRSAIFRSPAAAYWAICERSAMSPPAPDRPPRPAAGGQKQPDVGSLLRKTAVLLWPLRRQRLAVDEGSDRILAGTGRSGASPALTPLPLPPIKNTSSPRFSVRLNGPTWSDNGR